MTPGFLGRSLAGRRVTATALLAVAFAAGVAGCDSGGRSQKARAPVAPPPTVPAAPPRSFLEQLIPPPRGVLPAARVPGQIRRVVAGLPVERKVAQLLLVGFDGRDPSAPFFGMLRGLDLGGVVVERRNYTGAGALGALTGAIASATAGRSHEQPFVLAPQEGGDFSAFPDLPPRAAPGDLSGVLDAASEAARTARRLKQLGFNGVLAPDADVGAGTGADPLGPRAYSDDARQVSAYVAAVVAAFRRARMLSAPLHFPGIGGATGSTDDGPAEVGLDMRALGRRDLQPFRAAVQAGAPAVVVSHAGYAPDSFVVPGSLSHAIETDLLRGELGFRGLAITDDLEAGAIVAGNAIPTAAVEAVRAGADMVWISGPADWSAAYRAVLAAVRAHQIPLSRLNDAVTRIVTVKGELGLRTRG